jgi:DNA-binding response OmpR family regulator
MTKKVALVIEDDSDAAFIFAQALAVNGFEVKTINMGDKALEALQTETPDLILLDMHLPNIPGTDLIVQIRSQENTRLAKVIIVSADPRMAETVEDKADLVLIKPIMFSQIRDLIGRMLADTV